MTHPRPLRVAYLIAALDLGGSERQMVELASRLPRDRFNPEFLLLTHRGPLAARAEGAGLGVRVIGWSKRPVRAGDARRGLDIVRSALAIRAGRYDIVDAWLFHAYAIAAVTRPLTRLPILIAGRRSLSNFKEGYGRGYRFADHLARRSADAIVANSNFVRDDVAKFERVDPASIRVIHNGVEIPAPLSSTDRAALRGGWGFESGRFVVGCVANYKQGKGHEVLLRAIADVRRHVPELGLVLVGEGPLRPTLQSMINDLGLANTVRLHGHEVDARQLYGAFDLVVLASESEGLPNVLLEGAAAGRAAVATAAGGTTEVVVDGETGLLVPVGDEGGLARGIERLARDAALREAIGTAAKRRVSTVFGMDRFVSETAALYEELAEHRRSGGRRVFWRRMGSS